MRRNSTFSRFPNAGNINPTHPDLESGSGMNWVGGLIPFAAGVIFAAGGIVMIQRATTRDVNGLGRQYRRSLAAQVRILSAEITDAVLKEQFLALADLIDPK